MSRDDEGVDIAVSISPKDGGTVFLGNGKTIDLTIDRGEVPPQSGNPVIILPTDVLEDVNEISFELYVASPETPHSGFRLAGFVVEIELDHELEEGETVTVCLPVPEDEEESILFHYDEESSVWEPLESRLETVNGTLSVCAETDDFSLFGGFVADSQQEPDPGLEPMTGQGGEVGCSISSDAGAGNTPQRAVFNLLLIMSALLAVLLRTPSRGRER